MSFVFMSIKLRDLVKAARQFDQARMSRDRSYAVARVDDQALIQ